MRKIIALILGFIIGYFLLLHWDFITMHLGKNIADFLLLYVVALGIIHIGGILVKILAVVFVIIEPIADNYCYWYENTPFYKWLHRNDKHKY